VPRSQELDEFALIERHFAPLARSLPGSLGLLDDGALLEIEPDHKLVVAADMAIEGVHFTASDPPELIGRKVIRYNLSDLAAMGARPLAYLLALAKPVNRSSDWVGAIAGGLARDQEEFGISLVGGDTTSTPGPAVLSITVLGTVGVGGALLRAGARPGDAIFVSGTIGDSALGLAAAMGELGRIDASDQDYLLGRYQLPSPRLALGQALVGIATAAIDVSDGLIADLAHVCRASGVAATIEAEKIPFSAEARRVHAQDERFWRASLTGGDDYELLFCVPSDRLGEIEALGHAADVAVTQIGSISDGTDVQVIGENGEAVTFDHGGYRHF